MEERYCTSTEETYDDYLRNLVELSKVHCDIQAQEHEDDEVFSVKAGNLSM